MSQTPIKYDRQAPAISRRGFVKASAGLTFVIGSSGLIAACSGEQPMDAAKAFEANAYATIAPDGKITVQVPVAELGQGSMTALPLMFAEDADADWNDIVPVQVTKIRPEYGNPFFGGFIYTGGSRGVEDYYPKLRKAGAQARLLLMQAAAERWDVPVAELATEPSVVVHEPSGRRLTYGEIANFAKMPAEIPEISDDDLKPESEFRLIGSETPRIDIPLKIRGAAQYAMDVQVPGMVYAAVLHAPVEGERPLDVDDAETLKVDGVLQTVTLDHAVAVIGDTVEATRDGKMLLSVTWSEDSPLRAASLETSLENYSKGGNDFSQKGVSWVEEGEFDAAFEAAEETVSAEYWSDYVYHAQMEPLNATAHVYENGDGAEIWIGTQSQQLAILTAAATLGVDPDKIKLNQMYLGGGFGRRAEREPTYMLEAIALSKALNKPVKVIWSREDDVQGGWFRPATAQVMRAGFDENGDVVAWNHRVAGPSVLAFYNTVRWARADGRDIITMNGSSIRNYHIPNKLAEHIILDRQARLSPWRGVGTGYTKFAVESFVDELAEARGEDPVQFRLDRMHLSERGKRVLKRLREFSRWNEPREQGRALGVSLVDYHESVAGGVFEISVNERTGKVTVHDVWAVADIGLAVQPRNVIGQMEGSIVYGVGQSLTERIDMRNGEIQQSNFHDYIVPRITDVPDIHVEILESDYHPTGVGELALPLTSGGIANAFKAATGKRMRRLPLSPERVLEALKA